MGSKSESTAGEMATDVADWVAALWRRLREEATDRDDPAWPPSWLKVTAGVVGAALVLFVVLPLVLGLVGWVLSWGEHGVRWLVTWELLRVVTDPVRVYITGHAVGLPVSGAALWLAWQVIACASLVLGWIGAAGARVAWTLLGLATAAMVWAGTPGPARGLAVGITAAWWSLGAVLVFRRTGRGHAVVLTDRHTPHYAPVAAPGTRRVDVDSLNAAVFVLADVAALLRDTARHNKTTGGSEFDRDRLTTRAEQLEDYADQLVTPEVRRRRPPSTPDWRDDLAVMLDRAPLLDATDHHR